MSYRRVSAFLAMLLSLAALAAACGEPRPTVAPSPTAPPTVGQLAQSGQAVFAVHCAKCHGEKGEGFTGPPIIGPNAKLGKYANAQGLINFMGLSMPMDAPGSLTSDQYQQVLCYVLVKNNLWASGSPFNANQLDSVNLK